MKRAVALALKYDVITQNLNLKLKLGKILLAFKYGQSIVRGYTI